MNKKTKGAIAAGAAAVLLAGGAGTMAAWKAEAPLAQGTVTAGHLTIAQQGSGTWYWGDAVDASKVITNIGAVKLVPGDKVTYTGDYKLGIVGDNLAAKVSVSGGAVDTAALGRYLKVTPYGASSLTGLNQTSDNNRVVTAGATIEFDATLAGDNLGKDESATLSGISVTLEQTAS